MQLVIDHALDTEHWIYKWMNRFADTDYFEFTQFERL